MNRKLKVKCLVLDHDDTVVKSTPDMICNQKNYYMNDMDRGRFLIVLYLSMRRNIWRRILMKKYMM